MVPPPSGQLSPHEEKLLVVANNTLVMTPDPMTPSSRLYQIRRRCIFFFMFAAVVTMGVCAAAAVVSSGVLDALVWIITSNFITGLILTFDMREWPHRLQEIPFYIIFLCEHRLSAFLEHV